MASTLQCILPIPPSTSLRRRHRRRSSLPPPPPPASSSMPFNQRMQESLSLLDLMRSQSMTPDPSLLCSLLKSCADARSLHFGRLFHHHALLTGLHSDPFVANALILFYSNCGYLGLARQLFDEMPVRNVVSWTTAISMYHHAGFPRNALELFRAMKVDPGVVPNAFTYTVALNSCASVGDLETGIDIHEEVVRAGDDKDEFVRVALIDMYAKCGRVGAAREVFDGIPKPSVQAFTAMIEGHCANGEAKEATDIIRRALQTKKVVKVASDIGFGTLVKPCLMETSLRQGQAIHAHIVKAEHKTGAKTLSSIVDLYLNCNKVAFAYRLWKEMVVKDADLCRRLISECMQNELHAEALNVYAEMVHIDRIVVPLALKACVQLSRLEEGKQIHGRVVKDTQWFERTVISDLTELYQRCGKLEEACKLMK